VTLRAEWAYIGHTVDMQTVSRLSTCSGVHFLSPYPDSTRVGYLNRSTELFTPGPNYEIKTYSRYENCMRVVHLYGWLNIKKPLHATHHHKVTTLVGRTKYSSARTRSPLPMTSVEDSRLTTPSFMTRPTSIRLRHVTNTIVDDPATPLRRNNGSIENRGTELVAVKYGRHNDDDDDDDEGAIYA